MRTSSRGRTGVVTVYKAVGEGIAAVTAEWLSEGNWGKAVPRYQGHYKDEDPRHHLCICVCCVRAENAEVNRE